MVSYAGDCHEVVAVIVSEVWCMRSVISVASRSPPARTPTPTSSSPPPPLSPGSNGNSSRPPPSAQRRRQHAAPPTPPAAASSSSPGSRSTPPVYEEGGREGRAGGRSVWIDEMHACFHGGSGGSGRTKTISIIRDLTKNVRWAPLDSVPSFPYEGGRRRRGKGAEGEEDMEPQDKDVAAASATAKIASEEREGKTRGVRPVPLRPGVLTLPPRCVLSLHQQRLRSRCSVLASPPPCFRPPRQPVSDPSSPSLSAAPWLTWPCILAFVVLLREQRRKAGHLHGDQEKLSPSPTRATPLT
ncbi:hypothetical protein ZWY2020_035928 [Hordeum vulgare]|nr:hypothetical protein ZWY2020_035928 [Hordeum vulgare]